MKSQILGKLVGNTGDPNNLTMVVSSSFAGRRGGGPSPAGGPETVGF